MGFGCFGGFVISGFLGFYGIVKKGLRMDFKGLFGWLVYDCIE